MQNNQSKQYAQFYTSESRERHIAYHTLSYDIARSHYIDGVPLTELYIRQVEQNNFPYTFETLRKMAVSGHAQVVNREKYREEKNA